MASPHGSPVEFATLTWVAWYNCSRLLEPLGYVPPNEFEEAFYNQRAGSIEYRSQRCLTIGDRVSP